MQYTVLSGNNLHFEVGNEQGDAIGTFTMSFWQPAKATITTVYNDVFEIEAAGFWRNRMVMSKNGGFYAEIRSRPFKGLELVFENGRNFYFRMKSFWSMRSYKFVDDQENIVATSSSRYSWKAFAFRYEVDINEALVDRELALTLPYLIIYCTRLVRMRRAAAASI
jgi:hypothetical protein